MATQSTDAFESRKRKILADLSTPDTEYMDLSPKGSVDEGIRDLIHDINALSGLVTTSSCAGRISVFLEGRKTQAQKSPQEGQQQQQQQQRQFVPSGGKGAGRWLYVSHDPLDENRKSAGDVNSLHELFGLVPGDGRPPKLQGDGQAPRLVRFHYDPMILHIMTATLQHAQPVLSAASSSGFRESGLQSLRCLEDSEGINPIVAVRSSGLSLESVIGYCDDNYDDTSDNDLVIHSLVTEEYLEMLIAISNERFSVNIERKERFRTNLLELCSPEQVAHGAKTKGKTKPPGWEDPEARRERKRAEGLMRKKLLGSQINAGDGNTEVAKEGDDS